LSVGAILVALGMILDCFDGLIARVTRSTTNFGGQLDSLADVVTFGVAPATLMVAFMTKELAGDSIVPSPISDHALGRLTWVSAAIYVAFTAVRLARYNVEHAKADFDHRIFRGLPSPGAAAIMVALILFQDQPMGAVLRRAIVYATPFVAMGIAFLMVSRIPYRRFHRAYLLGRQPFGQFLVVMLVVAVFLAFKAETFLVIVLWYGLSGPLFYLVRVVRERTRPGHGVAATSRHGEERKLA
ncbi:MAG: CDP-alcohol phosphatidyltransferase family protein, partial [Planctomycetota bacterium]